MKHAQGLRPSLAVPSGDRVLAAPVHSLTEWLELCRGQVLVPTRERTVSLGDIVIPVKDTSTYRNASGNRAEDSSFSKRFEYSTDMIGDLRLNLHPMLRTRGEAGWQLVSIVERGSSSNLLIFIREMPLPSTQDAEAEVPEFTTADADLNWLLNCTAMLLSGRANMDTSICRQDALEKVERWLGVSAT